MSDQIIQMENVNKWFDDFQVLKDINLEVRQKQKIVVCGPSGSGKSTLIRCINRLEEHQKGKIIVDGIELSENTKNIEQVRAEVGMVFQQFNLFPHLSILDNCSLAPIWVKNIPKKLAEEQALKELEKVKIYDQWMKSNQWFGDDLFLTNEALKIHIELEDKEKIDTDSQEYYNQIDTRIYNKHKRKLLKYFSHGN